MSNEKEFQVIPDGTGLYQVKLEHGGELPKVLQQKFTSPQEANKSIRVYVANRRDYPSRGRKKNGTGTTESSV